MSRDRTYFVKLNIDDMAANIAALDGPEEKAAWLDGFMVGARGALPRESWWDPKRIGHAFGFECFQRAEVFRESQTEKSLKAVEAKASKRAQITQTVPTGTPTGTPAGHPVVNLASNQQPEAIRPETQKPATSNARMSREQFGKWAALYHPSIHAEALSWFDELESLGWTLANGQKVNSVTHLFTGNVKAGKITKKSQGLPLL